MSARDHVRSDDICIWCHEPWPCTVAEVRKELAESIIKEHFSDLLPGSEYCQRCNYCDKHEDPEVLADMREVVEATAELRRWTMGRRPI